MPHVETHIKIRLDDLRALNACKDGLKFYKNLAISIGQSRGGLPKSIKIPWSPYAMLLALTNDEARPWVRWAIHRGLLPMWSLAGQDLGGADLYVANLSYANLSYANLYAADLSYANLYGANLSGANLSDAYYPTGDVPAGWQRVSDRLQRAA